MNQRNGLLARAIVAIALGAVAGYFLGQHSAAGAAKAREMTLDAYVKDFPEYKSRNEHALSTPAAIIVMAIMSAGFFTLYEVLVQLVARLTGGAHAEEHREVVAE